MAVGPILSAAASDIFCDNENGANFLFRNQGDGTFIDVAPNTGACMGACVYVEYNFRAEITM